MPDKKDPEVSSESAAERGSSVLFSLSDLSEEAPRSSDFSDEEASSSGLISLNAANKLFGDTDSTPTAFISSGAAKKDSSGIINLSTLSNLHDSDDPPAQASEEEPREVTAVPEQIIPILGTRQSNSKLKTAIYVAIGLMSVTLVVLIALVVGKENSTQPDAYKTEVQAPAGGAPLARGLPTADTSRRALSVSEAAQARNGSSPPLGGDEQGPGAAEETKSAAAEGETQGSVATAEEDKDRPLSARVNPRPEAAQADDEKPAGETQGAPSAGAGAADTVKKAASESAAGQGGAAEVGEGAETAATQGPDPTQTAAKETAAKETAAEETAAEETAAEETASEETAETAAKETAAKEKPAAPSVPAEQEKRVNSLLDGLGTGVKEATNVPTVLSRAVVKKAVARYNARVRSCAGPGKSGTVIVRFTISPSGLVSMAKSAGAKAGTPEARCVTGIVRSMKFPAFSGAPMTINYPFILP